MAKWESNKTVKNNKSPDDGTDYEIRNNTAGFCSEHVELFEQ